MGFPLVLIPENGLSVKQTEPLEKAFHFRDTAELRRFWDPEGSPLNAIIQPMLSGTSLGYGAVYHHGKPMAEIFQQRGREHEPASQLACYSKTLCFISQCRISPDACSGSWSGMAPLSLRFIETIDSHCFWRVCWAVYGGLYSWRYMPVSMFQWYGMDFIEI